MVRRVRVLRPILYWIPAVITGVIAILYARLIEETFRVYKDAFNGHPVWFFALTPALFWLATFLVQKFAPEASGSGIPQVLHAIHSAPQSDDAFAEHAGKLSIRTMVVKILSSTVGILGGASIGREGPTVQVASSIFSVAVRVARRFGWTIDYRSFLIAGGAAGVSAAFNTPLAGIAFAIEEIAEDFFFKFRQDVMVSVIIAGITAQAIAGDYLYFGHPSMPKPTIDVLPESLLIGLIAGAAGGLFALLLSSKKAHRFLPSTWWVRALVCGVVCAVLGYWSHAESSGSGYQTVKNVMDGAGAFRTTFGLEKFVTTVLSYLSGMAGGIFSPCLSIGAGFGYTLGQLLQFPNLKICALIGMVSFFSGVVQAPLTSVIIVMEMTDEHVLVIPFLIASYLSYGVSKLMMPEPLYRKLAGLVEHGVAASPEGV